MNITVVLRGVGDGDEARLTRRLTDAIASGGSGDLDRRIRESLIDARWRGGTEPQSDTAGRFE